MSAQANWMRENVVASMAVLAVSSEVIRFAEGRVNTRRRIVVSPTTATSTQDVGGASCLHGSETPELRI
jgi:F420-0:gamma-glutamyl ligase